MPFSGYIDSRLGGRKENQDFCGFSDTSFGLLIAVCDGMGGGPGGRTASVMAVETIIHEIQHADSKVKTREELLKLAVKTANKFIYQKGQEIQALKGMGSTATVLLISQQSAIVAFVGDSRVYQFRGRKKKFRTFDHSMVFELVKQKVLTEEQARLSEESNLITRALGIKPDVDVEIYELSYEKGDRFMLCTDGIWGALPEKELIKIVSGSESAGRALDDVVVLVDELGFRNGGTHDNLTAAIIESNINSKLKEKMSTRTRNFVIALVVLCCVSLACNIVLLNRPTSPQKYNLGSDSIPVQNETGKRDTIVGYINKKENK